MLRRITICALALCFTTAAFAQNFTKLPSGLEYTFLKKSTSTKKAFPESSILLNIVTTVSDSVIFDSKKINGNKPVPAVVQSPKHDGDLHEGFAMMSEGDVAIFRAPIEKAVPVKEQWPPFAKSGDWMTFRVEMISVKSKADQAKEAKMAAANEEIAIKKYIAENKLGSKVKKTPSGLYYVIRKNGTGPNATAGQEVSMNYTGKLIDGEKFDSNTDPAFKHVTPLKFPLGKGSVIKGWDEGITYLNKGAQAQFIIPSSLGYGSRGSGAKIAPNSVLIFDVELLDMKTPEKPASNSPEEQEKMIAQYLKDNKLMSSIKRTPSGLYYMITKKGTGANAQSGQTVSMNYTGSLLNGTLFDSNVDPKFNHVSPFSFVLGQGRVIKGWDEGIALLNPGSKAKFVIPSRLAYGERSAGPNIPANSILVFDVEMLETK